MKLRQILIYRVVLMLFCVFATFDLNSQTAKLLLGESLEDENKPSFIDFIDSDESGVYFFKHGKKNIFYVDKYDASSLKLVYRCVLPNPFKDKTVLTKYFNERIYYTILNNGVVDVIYVAQEEKKYNFYHIRISAKGVCSDVNLVYSEEYSNDVSKRNAMTRISSNKRFIMISNSEEVKNINLLTCLKITNTPKEFKISKHYDVKVDVQDTEVQIEYYNLFNDGRIGAFYNNGKKDFVFCVNEKTNKFNKDIKEIIPNPDFLFDFKNYIVGRSNLRPKMFRADVILSEIDTSLVFTIFDKQKKTYAFVELNYKKKSNEFSKGKINYMNSSSLGRFKGGIKDFDFISSERITFNQAIQTDNFLFKVLSRNYVVTTNLSIKSQGFLIILIYNKNSELVSQSIVPMRIRHINRDEFEDEKGVHLSETFNVNYGTIRIKDDVYFLLTEHKSNKDFDINKGSLNDFEEASNTKESYLACYKVTSNNLLQRIELNYDKNLEVYNIINNGRRNGNYQYVYVKSKKDRVLGKVLIE